ncbi:cation:proton antiporter, partial [uncultured Nocardioides sp.]
MSPALLDPLPVPLLGAQVVPPVVMASSEGVPRYLTATAALVLAAAVVGYLSVRVRVLPIVGFLLAGVLIGPAQLGLVSSTEAVDAAAEIGVILLLFTIGIEFSLERLARVWRWVVFGGGSQVVLATGAGLAVTVALGRDWKVGLFTGFL